MHTYFNEINEQVQNEKDEIIQLLEEFASGELKEQQKKAKDEIAAIRGDGTVKRQNLSIENFYDNIVKSLDDELRKFLEKRLDKFSTGLSINASNLFPKLRTSIHQQLRQRKQAIEERL